MILRPTRSYQIEVPDGIRRDADGRVCSLWLDEHPLLLQLSSYQRATDNQVSAAQRLQDRIDKTPSVWRPVLERLCQDQSADQAVAEQFDGKSLWLHCYLVWPHLTVYATLSGPEDEVHNPSSWGRVALTSVSIVFQ
jgi:hypothetical protein